MEIYLIRHTPTATQKGLCYGQTDVDLTENYRAEFEKIRQKLPDIHENAQFFSSPLARCLKLAQFLSSNIQLDKRLLEINFGDWENQRFDELDEEKLRHWTENFVEIAPPNGESFHDLCERAEQFWQEITQLKTPQIFIVTHAGIIRALLARILQLSPKNAFQFCVDCGSVHKFQRVENYTHIHFLNL